MTWQDNSANHMAVVRVYEDAGNVIEAHEHNGDLTTPGKEKIVMRSSMTARCFGWLTSSSDYSGPFAVQICSIQTERPLL